MKITIGSRNPVKIAACREVFSRFLSDVEVFAIDAESGVSSQPWGEEETRRGAVNRAKNSLAEDAQYSVGLEGGVVETEFGLMSCAWACVIDDKSTIGLGGGVYFMLPDAVTEKLRSGFELGDAMDMLTGQHNTKQGHGAVGILTDGLINRQKAYENILFMALTKFRNSEAYNSGEDDK